MKLLYWHIFLLLSLAFAWTTATPVKSSYDSKFDAPSNTNSLESRRFLGTFRPFMRVLGMMGIPLLPLILLRQLIGTGAGANTQGVGAGAGYGSLGGLGILAPFGAGAGLGALRPLGGGGGAAAAGALRPLGLMRPLGSGGLRPLSNLLGNAANAGQAAGAAATATNAAAAAGTLFLKKRSTDAVEKPNRFNTFLGTLAKLEKVVDNYDLSVPDCQRLIVCDVHRRSINPSFGSFTEKLIQAFGVENRLERSRFTSNTKTVLKDFLKAARNGLQQRDCSAIYYKCPVAVAESSERKGKKEV